MYVLEGPFHRPSVRRLAKACSDALRYHRTGSTLITVANRHWYTACDSMRWSHPKLVNSASVGQCLERAPTPYRREGVYYDHRCDCLPKTQHVANPLMVSITCEALSSAPSYTPLPILSLLYTASYLYPDYPLMDPSVQGYALMPILCLLPYSLSL